MRFAQGLNVLTDEQLLTVVDLQKISESVGSKPRTEQKWLRALSFSPFVAFVLDLSDTMIGFGRIESDGKIYMIYDMCVSPKNQGMGLGTKILESLLSQAAQAGVNKVGLDAWTPEARLFYLKNGFVDSEHGSNTDNFMEITLNN